MAASVSPDGLIAIVFTDIERSTELLKIVGDDEFARILTNHTSDIEEICYRKHGHIANTTGDGFFLAFSSAINAAEAAFEILGNATKLNLRLRLGLHIGEPIPVGGNYLGTAVHETARLMSKAEPGKVITSDVVKRILEGQPQFIFKSLGAANLKGFEDSNEIFDLTTIILP